MPLTPVRPLIDRLLADVDRAIPGLLEGLYVVGSVALDDYRGDRSDLDYIGVLGRSLTPGEFEALGAAHDRLGLAKYEGIYVTWDDLTHPPVPELGSAHVSEAGFLPRAGFNANPAMWRTLKRHGLAARGPGPAHVEVFDDDDLLTTFCRENLTRYWRTWGRSVARPGKNWLFGLTDGGVVWGALGPPRLLCTIATGRIISKTDAAQYGIDTFGDEWRPLLESARRCRVEGTGSPLLPRWRRRNDLVRFVELVCARADD